MFTLSFTSCKKNIVYTIGQEHAGGVIAFLDNTGQHGLVISKKDIAYARDGSSGVNWSDANNRCNNYNSDEGGWRLPTQDELLKIYESKDLFNFYELSNGSWGVRRFYWSSTINEDGQAWQLCFGETLISKFQCSNCKNSRGFTRAVKSF